MAEIIRLAPHDPLPDDRDHILVLKRFAEEDPGRTEVETSRGRGGPRREGVAIHPGNAFEAAVAEAGRKASAEHVARVYVIDRTAGKREQDILRHHGDHGVHMETLVDSDVEDNEAGPDMRRP